MGRCSFCVLQTRSQSAESGVLSRVFAELLAGMRSAPSIDLMPGVRASQVTCKRPPGNLAIQRHIKLRSPANVARPWADTKYVKAISACLPNPFSKTA